MNAQTAYALLYIEVNLISVALLGIIRHKTGGLSKMVAQRNFAMAIYAQMVFFLSDTLYVMMISGLLPLSRAGILAAKTVYFFSTTLMCFSWFVYFEHMQESPFVQNRKRVLIASALVWVMGALLVVNLSTGILFYVDGQGAYQRGPMFLLQYLLPYLYVFVTCFRAALGLLQPHWFAQRRMLLSLALFPVVPAGAGLLQFLYPQLPLACGALSITTLILYLDWLEQMISIDPLTRLNNRKQLAYHYDQWAQGSGEGIPLYLLLIDANKFKSINDTYGHIQGDAALVRIADALRLGCKGFPRRANIARYGGDEFVILAAAEDPREIDTLRERIGQSLAELNRVAKAPYDLSVSIGVARAAPDMSLKDLIAKADTYLYQEKAKGRPAPTDSRHS